jgi:hypothetical protein
VSFSITPSETLTEEVKYLSEDVVNSLIFEQHLENAELSDENLILSRQFRIGETVYSSADSFVNPIVVTATNEARGALTTRLAGGVDVGYGWIVANDRLKDNSDEFDGGGKEARLFIEVGLIQVLYHLQPLPTTLVEIWRQVGITLLGLMKAIQLL